MERVIKFRGQRIDNNEWVYGSLILRKDSFGEISLIEVDKGDFVYEMAQVKPETVGQFTGLTDKNGKDIYEGDVVVRYDEDWDTMCEWEDDDSKWNDRDNYPIKETNRDCVTLSAFRFWLKNEGFGYEGEDLQHWEYYQIIGDIHTNPELLNQ